MNKDDMTDDAEFDAFLKGEGELSRRLQAMPQPAPPASLDAAILARARADMAREQRPPAANDPGEAPVTPRLARSFGERFRIPMGIAATLLAGVFANQAFNKGDPLRGQMSEEDNLPQAVIVSPVETPSAAAPPHIVIPEDLAAALPAAAPAPVPVAEQPMPPKVVMEQAAAADRQMAALSEEKRARSAEEESSLQKRKAMPAMRAGAASQAKELQFPAAASPVAAAAPPPTMEVPPPPAAAPAPQVDAYSRSQGVVAKPAQVPPELTRVEVTGSSVKRVVPLAPEQWLAHIVDLLDGGLNSLALEEWKKFRAAHPGVKVEPALETKLEAMRKE